MVYTKEEFKRLWEANDNGSGITFDDIADCAKAWGISSSPRTRPIDEIRYQVLKAAQTNDAEEYNPNKETDMIIRRRATADDLQKEYWLRQRKYIIWRTKDGEDIPIDKLTDKHLKNILKMLNRSPFRHLEQTYIPEDLIGDYEDAIG